MTVLAVQPAAEAGVKLPMAAPPAMVTVTVVPTLSGSVTARPENGARVALSLTGWLPTAPLMEGASCVAVTATVSVWVAVAPDAPLALSVTVTCNATEPVLPGAMAWAAGAKERLCSTAWSWAAVPVAVRVPVEAS